MRIAVADDDPKILQTLHDVLSDAGHEVRKFEDGAELLQLLNEDPQKRPYTQRPVPVHLVLLDLIMPEKTGDDVLTFLKRNRRYADLPVIIITARANADLGAYQATYPNVVHLLRKPFLLHDLLEAVRSIASRRIVDAPPAHSVRQVQHADRAGR